MSGAATLTRQEAEEVLITEAELLDSGQFEQWQRLFTADCFYHVPLGVEDPEHQAYLIFDDALRLDERVYHLAHVPFPSQSPRSETMHFISGVRVSPSPDESDDTVRVDSNQLIHELRLGDFRQVGLGEPRSFAARVRHLLRRTDDGWRIKGKTVTLLTRGTPQSNLTFLL